MLEHVIPAATVRVPAPTHDSRFLTKSWRDSGLQHRRRYELTHVARAEQLHRVALVLLESVRRDSARNRFLRSGAAISSRLSLEFRKALGNDGIVHPTTASAIAHEAVVVKHTKMVRQQRLRDADRLHDLADATVADGKIVTRRGGSQGRSLAGGGGPARAFAASLPRYPSRQRRWRRNALESRPGRTAAAP